MTHDIQTQQSWPKIYLAGPDVFLANCLDIDKEKKVICKKYALRGFVPSDNNVGRESGHNTAYDLAMNIAKANFELMKEADSCIANLTPFRGPSADVGTVGEIHYMYGLGKPVFGYSNDSRLYDQRVIDDYYKGEVVDKYDNMLKSKALRGKNDDMLVENYDAFDNLMIPYTMENSGGRFFKAQSTCEDYYGDLSVFEKIARAAAEFFYGQEILYEHLKAA